MARKSGIGYHVEKVARQKAQDAEVAEIAASIPASEVLIPEVVQDPQEPAFLEATASPTQDWSGWGRIAESNAQGRETVPSVPPVPTDTSSTEIQSPLSTEEQVMVEERKRKRGERLQQQEIAHVLWLYHTKHLSQNQIAKRMNCHQSTISSVLSAWQPTEQLAKAILKKGASTLATRVVKDADVDQAIDVLTRLKVIDAPVSDKGQAGGVNVLVGINLSEVLK